MSLKTLLPDPQAQRVMPSGMSYCLGKHQLTAVPLPPPQNHYARGSVCGPALRVAWRVRSSLCRLMPSWRRAAPLRRCGCECIYDCPALASAGTD